MARKVGHQKKLYEEKIKADLIAHARKDLADPRLNMVSFTRVELNPDYSQAKVYWDSFDVNRREEISEALGRSAQKLRSLLAKSLNVRHTPMLVFYYDSQFDDEFRIHKLLHEPSE